LNSEKIGKLWKKSKLNSEKIWKMGILQIAMFKKISVVREKSTGKKVREKSTGKKYGLRMRAPEGTLSGSRHFRSKHAKKGWEPQLPVAHARTQGNPFGVT